MISPGFIVSALATLAVVVLFLFLVFEDWALWNKAEPITGYTRQAWREQPHLFWLISVIVTAVISHFAWH